MKTMKKFIIAPLSCWQDSQRPVHRKSKVRIPSFPSPKKKPRST